MIKITFLFIILLNIFVDCSIFTISFWRDKYLYYKLGEDYKLVKNMNRLEEGII